MKRLLFVLVIALMIIPLASADVVLHLQKSSSISASPGEIIRIPADITNNNPCPVECFYKYPGFPQGIDNHIGSNIQGKFDFTIQLKVPLNFPSRIEIKAICVEQRTAQCSGNTYDSAAYFEFLTPDNSQTANPNQQNENKLPDFKANGFRIELFEISIDGLIAGSRQTTKATLFNEDQTKLSCSYIIPGTEEEQIITDGLTAGSNIAFNLIFFVPEDCREPCPISAHIICQDKNSGNIAGETDVSFDLTGIQTKANQIFGFVMLFIIIAAITFGIYTLVKHFGKRRHHDEREESDGKRKLCAIMFTDMKGYSKEMGKDEETTLKKMWRYEKAMKEIIKEHDGRVVKTIGDAIMGDFSSAVNAVKSAIEIQNLLKKEDIKIRIGIHLGDVIHKGGDIFGDGVNIASRIESICEPGQIYISEDIYSQVKGKINAGFENLGNRPLKNIDSPPKVYKIK